MDRLGGSRSPLALALLVAAAAGCFVDPGEAPTGGAAASATTSTADPTTSTGDADASATSTGAPTTTTTTTTTTGEAGAPTAFRITSLSVIDPHFYGTLMMGGECADITELVNFGIESELSGGDVSYALIFYDLDTKAADTPLLLTSAQCNGALDTCSQSVDDPGLLTAAVNSQSSACTVVVASTLNNLYTPDGSPNIPAAPCFVSGEGAGSVPLSDTLPKLHLEKIALTATYVVNGEDVDALLKGSLRGYLTESNASAVDGQVSGFLFNVWTSIAGGGSCQVDPNTPIDDTDPNPDPMGEQGVWVYLNFEAAPIEWLE